MVFTANNAGCLTGGFSTGHEIVERLTIKPTSTILKLQQTIVKVLLEDVELYPVP